MRAASMTSRSTALTCWTSPSGWPARGASGTACGPSAPTVHGTSTTASSGSPATVVPLRTSRTRDAGSPRAIAAMMASATPS